MQKVRCIFDEPKIPRYGCCQILVALQGSSQSRLATADTSIHITVPENPEAPGNTSLATPLACFINYWQRTSLGFPGFGRRQVGAEGMAKGGRKTLEVHDILERIQRLVLPCVIPQKTDKEEAQRGQAEARSNPPGTHKVDHDLGGVWDYLNLLPQSYLSPTLPGGLSQILDLNPAISSWGHPKPLTPTEPHRFGNPFEALCSDWHLTIFF